MYTEIVYLISALLGFLIIFLISNHYKSNRYANIYLIGIFLISSIRHLFNGLSKIALNINFLRELDLFFFVFVSTLSYLYFTNLIRNRSNLIKKDLVRLLIPLVLFIVISIFLNYSPNILGFKVLLSLFILLNVYYVVKLYFILKKFVWERISDIFLINKQNSVIKKWTLLFFGFFVFVFVNFIVFFIELIFNNIQFWHLSKNNFLLIDAVVWIFLYFKILLTPELLYGYEIFQNKLNDYNKQKMSFDNIWIMDDSVPVTNIQDTVLKEKILPQLENYIIEIENKALNTSIFFSEGFNVADFANYLNIPKSHLGYIFKYHSNISFIDFKKIIRIQKSTLLISEGYLKVNTFESLAAEVGFSTYSAFFKSFKSIIGVSPQEYYSQIKTATDYSL
jgi:AraC-like DNA-binding protein